MSDETIEFAELPRPYEDIRLVTKGEDVGLDFYFRDAATKTLRQVRMWLDLDQAATLSAQLATLCKQFGVEPPTGRQTMQ